MKEKTKRLRLFFGLYLLIIPILLLVYAYPTVKVLGKYLITEDEPQKVEALFVLGGSPSDRGAAAAKLYHEGFTDRIVCTSEIVPSILEVLDTLIPESEITRDRIIQMDVPSSKVEALVKATSTREEAEAIYQYCEEQRLKKIMILTSKFHTRRSRYVFEKRFEGSGVELVFFGAPSSSYNESEWWNFENGLLMVNNEYVKLVYYRLFY